MSNPVVGAGAPAYPQVGDFWTATGGKWDQIAAAWSAADAAGGSAANYQVTAAKLKEMLDSSRSFWGPAVQAKTGKSFDAGFANPLMAEYGVSLSDPRLARQARRDRPGDVLPGVLRRPDELLRGPITSITG